MAYFKLKAALSYELMSKGSAFKLYRFEGTRPVIVEDRADIEICRGNKDILEECDRDGIPILPPMVNDDGSMMFAGRSLSYQKLNVGLKKKDQAVEKKVDPTFAVSSFSADKSDARKAEDSSVVEQKKSQTKKVVAKQEKTFNCRFCGINCSKGGKYSHEKKCEKNPNKKKTATVDSNIIGLDTNIEAKL